MLRVGILRSPQALNRQIAVRKQSSFARERDAVKHHAVETS
jgi:hypothetical protein